MRRRSLALFAALAVAICAAPPARATLIRTVDLDALSSSADRIFRGSCVAVEATTASVAGTLVPATDYTFEVSEPLKGALGRLVTFRQVGVPGGGPRDLGRLGGLPVYAVGREYLLFLLPRSGAGLTSPSGAGQGAFAIEGNEARALSPRTIVGLPSDPSRPHAPTVRYDSLRDAVLDRLAREVTP
jgi:hypothetical protein